MTHIFVVTPDLSLAENVQNRLANEGTAITISRSQPSCLSGCDLLILHACACAKVPDQTSPDQTSMLGILQRTASAHPKLPIITILQDPDDAFQLALFRQGVRHCLTRPIDFGRLRYLVESLTLQSRLAERQKRETTMPLAFPDSGSAMQELGKRINHLADRRVNVLLLGETGVGKTYIARLLHQASSRAHLPFVDINCSSIPETLFESELFGHRRGAFTGADRDREGRFDAVAGGTLLLDDVEATPLACQAKLLRAIEDRAYEPVGSNITKRLDGQIVSASNSDLNALAASKKFRADLLYRLGVVQLVVPPLRQRTDEIPGLVEAFLRSLAARHQIEVPEVDRDVMTCFANYAWPGNLRELRNCLEHAMMFCDGGRLRLEDLPATIPTTSPKAALDSARRQGEEELIRRTLQQFHNNRTRAAAALGISRAALYKRMGSLGIH